MISADNNAVCAAAGAAVPATTGWPRTRRGDSGIEVHTRTRIKTEEKTKVVTAVWGTELIQFIAALAFLHQDDLKKGVEFILFFKSSWCKIASGAKIWITGKLFKIIHYLILFVYYYFIVFVRSPIYLFYLVRVAFFFFFLYMSFLSLFNLVKHRK